ncbi:helix-turn-helix domain-containing protein [Campylobacter sp. faydin G-105]|uniref:helix-turn-helix transcriptional regulator n=1 Tax=Campylobacter anatolicus TaxID=2829105 RepID=UPI001B9B6E2D|nr:helix-turn-helix domain-containing protein [Campylobacter anatolicus]MBR8461522.1 helix-turn-helix domain-containing protein [Campylobacter anatolicus]
MLNLNLKDPITTQKACEIIGCSRVTLWRYVKDGKFKQYAITKRNNRYSLSEILSFIQSTAVLDGKPI